ncbi:hypothetical protein [Ruminococcus difficilis]|uniref:Pilus assembly protein PilX n=1 Tax=Ruminococcus difficilis TaxID=2763069 RepID=A0A934U3M7_9FIRM|nr:hypothetical protein [Ruminococcus difficilis]MBK6088467.1 hypothetical protein [Ruminococcus difficilis]
MNIKKWNARLSLLTIVLFLIHEGYQLYAYTTMYYNPVLSKVTGYVLTGALALHVILSVMSVFILHDAKKVTYKKLNIKTVLQRVSGVLIVLILPLHIFSFGILKSSVGGVGYILTEIAQILFYAALCCHISLSFSNALVTLGYLADMRKKRVIDIVVTIICVILFIAASVIITSAHTMIFKG